MSIQIVLITAAAYFRTTHFDFVLWDDDLHVYDNPYLQPLTWHSFAQFWLHPYQSLYIPISYTLIALVSLIARAGAPSPALTEFDTNLNPHVFHGVNLALHAINALLAFFLIRRTVKSDIPAALGALLFALHPLQVESVAWVSEVRGLLSAAFALLGMIFYLKASAEDDALWTIRSGAALVLFVLALLAKPTAVMAPFVLFVWDMFYVKRPWLSVVLRVLPWFAVAGIFTSITHLSQPCAPDAALPSWAPGLITVDTIGFYIEKLFWPFNLSAEYGRTPERVIANHLYFSTVAAFVTLVLFCAVYAKRTPWLVPGVLTFVLFLLPVSGVVPFAYQYFSTVADRYAYLALLGPAFIVAVTLDKLPQLKVRSAAAWSAAAFLILLLIRTEAQLSVWQDTRSLFTNAAALAPNDWLPQEKLGYEDMRLKNYAGAEQRFKNVIAEGPQDAKFWVELGSARQGEKCYSEAESDDNRALSMSPGFPLALYHRAECEALTGSALPSIADYRASVDQLPTTSYAHFELAMELGSVNRFNEAAAELRKTVELHPGFLTGYYYLALTYSKLGQPDLAQASARIALSIDPAFAPVFPFVSVAQK